LGQHKWTRGNLHNKRRRMELRREGRGGEVMKAITRSDIKRIRRAIKIADRANEYEIIEWAFGEIESVMNKAEAVINKEREGK